MKKQQNFKPFGLPTGKTKICVIRHYLKLRGKEKSVAANKKKRKKSCGFCEKKRSKVEGSEKSQKEKNT